MCTRMGSDGSWTRKRLPVPDNQTIGFRNGEPHGRPLFSGRGGFPDAAVAVAGRCGAMDRSLWRSRRSRSSTASGDVVEQLEATSKDGTKVPYFVVHRKDMPYDGSNPTLLTAYGGFQISIRRTTAR